MDIDRRLHEAGHQWRQSQGPALPAPKLDTPLQKTPPRRWMTGLIPLAASAAVAATVIGVVVLHDAPASHQAPGGSTSTSSPTSSPTPAPTASTPAQASSTVTAPQPSTAVVSPSVAGKGAAVTPNSTKSTTPTIDTGIAVYGNCTTPSVEPVEIVLTCADRGVVLQGLHWTSWTSASAEADGTLKYNDCTPSCAMGHFHYVPGTRVTLTHPVRGAGGQLVWSRVQFSPQPPGWDTGPNHGGPMPLPTQPN